MHIEQRIKGKTLTTDLGWLLRDFVGGILSHVVVKPFVPLDR